MTEILQVISYCFAKVQHWVQEMSQQELFYFLLNVLAILAIIRIIRREIQSSNEKKQRKAELNAERFISENENWLSNYNKSVKKKKKRQWYSTGWFWDEEKQLWVPPDYMSEQARKEWIWDEEKKIWRRNEKQ